jgi:hypothetical protein
MGLWGGVRIGREGVWNSCRFLKKKHEPHCMDGGRRWNSRTLVPQCLGEGAALVGAAPVLPGASRQARAHQTDMRAQLVQQVRKGVGDPKMSRALVELLELLGQP